MTQPDPPAQVEAPRTPLQLVAGALGSGKTTLLRRLLAGDIGRVAVLVNEFGELGIDGRVLTGRDVDLVELTGGCVCCSLAGEFEAAIDEILDRVDPEMILVEATGIAEADALVLDVEDNLPRVRIDTVVVLVDADVCHRFASFGYAERGQIEAGDIVLINKAELVDAESLARIRRRVEDANPGAVVVETTHAAVDPQLLAPAYARSRSRPRRDVDHGHDAHGLETFTWSCAGSLDRACLEAAVAGWPHSVYRAKGRLRVGGAPVLFNYVAGRWSLEPVDEATGENGLVFIGPGVAQAADPIVASLERCRE